MWFGSSYGGLLKDGVLDSFLILIRSLVMYDGVDLGSRGGSITVAAWGRGVCDRKPLMTGGEEGRLLEPRGFDPCLPILSNSMSYETVTKNGIPRMS